MREASSPRIHVNILAWTGYEDSAAQIEQEVKRVADRVSVIYSLPQQPPTYPSHWHTVDYNCFFGCKFKKAVDLHDSGVLLQIQADAQHEDWSHIVSRARETFARLPDLGVWGPSVDYSMWTLDKVFLADFDAARSLVAVRQTDGIVWALADTVVSRMKSADYSANPLGWGIDSLAVAYAYANGLLVLRDTSVNIVHPKGKGYGREEAGRQMEIFMKQLTFQEKLMLHLTRKRPSPLSTKDLIYLLFRRLTGQNGD